jgi:hypothetical protein
MVLVRLTLPFKRGTALSERKCAAVKRLSNYKFKRWSAHMRVRLLDANVNWELFDSVEQERQGRPAELADIESISAQMSGIEVYRLCSETRKLENYSRRSRSILTSGVNDGADRKAWKQIENFVEMFGMHVDTGYNQAAGFRYLIASPSRLRSWIDSEKPQQTNLALSDSAFEQLTSGGVRFEALANLISGSKVLHVFRLARDLEYTRTLKGRYWKWMMGDLYSADQDAELKSLFGLKLDRWRKQTDETFVFDVGDREKLRAWIESDT